MSDQKQILLPSPARSSTPFSFIAIDGEAINDQLINECAKLFSANYGIWGKSAPGSLAGNRVRMSANKLKSELLSVPRSTVVATCFEDSRLLGHAFATVWKYDGGVVGWVTQLVVDSGVRRCYIATQLLQTLKRHKLFQDVTAVGLVSSHPAAVAAMAKYSNVKVDMIDTDFITKNAAKILDSAPVVYIKNIKPSGALFEPNCTTGAVSCLFTRFYVDHHEPIEALNVFKKQRLQWVLGELPEGHEFLIVIPVA